jgi:hypothetical protein
VHSERAVHVSSHFLRDDDGGGPQRPPALRRGRGGVRRERDAVEVDECDDVAFHRVAGAILGVAQHTRRDTKNDRDRRQIKGQRRAIQGLDKGPIRAGGRAYIGAYIEA